MEDASSLPQFTWLIPTTNEEVGSRIEDALAEAHEEPYADDLVAGRSSGEREGEKRPYQLAAWDPDGRANLCQYELGRKLADDITGSPGNVDQVELV